MCETFVDLSHTITSDLITYPGLPAPKITAFLSHETSKAHYGEGTEFHIGKVEMVANTGTYLDAPFHRYKDREDIAGLALETLANIQGVCIAISGDVKSIGPAYFKDQDLAQKAVLIHTDWARHFGTDAYVQNHPHLMAETARYLRDQGAALVGIDSLNVDATAGKTRPVHSILLEAGIPIVEHMRGLDQLPAIGFRFFAVPAKVQGLGSFPVRAFALV